MTITGANRRRSKYHLIQRSFGRHKGVRHGANLP